MESCKAPAFLTISSQVSHLPNELPLSERQSTAFVVCSGQRMDTESNGLSTGAVQAPASPAAFALPGGCLDACHLPPLSQSKPSCSRTSLFHRVPPISSTDSLNQSQEENVTNLQLELASLGQLSSEAVLKKSLKMKILLGFDGFCFF